MRLSWFIINCKAGYLKKSLIPISLFLLTFFSFHTISGQTWKQYADSAEMYKKQNRQVEAITYYIKAKIILQPDSMKLLAYSALCDSIGKMYMAIGQFEKAEPFYQAEKRIREKLPGKTSPDYVRSCNNLAWLYNKTKQYAKAETLLLEVKQIRENQTGKEHADYASTCNALAILYTDMKQNEKAGPLFLEAKQIREKVLGKEHPDYGVSCDNLALFFENSRQYNKAEPIYLEIRQIRGKFLGMESLAYATSCNSLANLYRNMRKHEQAEPLYLEAMQIRGKVLGKEHPDYSASCNNVAELYYSMKQYAKAIPLLIEAKQIREKLLGREHLDYAQSCHNLALLYQSQAEYGMAEKLYLEAKQIQEKKAGKENLDYARSCNNLASLYKDKGQYAKVEPLLLESMQVRKKLLGEEHPDYISTRNNLAIIYMDRGMYEKAEPLYLEAKQSRQKLFGREDPDYAASCNNLANLYMNLGQYDKAEQLFLEAKKIREKVLGKQHADYAISLNDLAGLYYKKGMYAKAELLYLEAKLVREKMPGKQHPDYARSCNNLAALYKNMGQYAKAELMHLEAMQIQKKVLGKEHPDYGASCNNLANLYRTMGQYTKAEILYVEDLQIKEKLLGRGHVDYALSCNNLALLYHNQGEYVKAGPLYIESKQIREKVLGKEHPDYAESCNNLATFYMDTRQNEKAHQLIQEAKKIYEKILGKENPGYARSCNNLGVFYKSTGQYAKADLLLLEAKQIRGKIVGKQHPDYGSTCSNLANLYWEMHMPLPAEKEFKELFLVNMHNLFSVFQFTNEKEKKDFVVNTLREDDKAYSFYVSEKFRSGQPYALSLFNRNLILSFSQALRKQVFFAGDTVLINKYNEWLNVKKDLSILYSTPIKERKESTGRIEEKAGQLEKELTQLSSTFKNQYQKQRVTWQTIQQSLNADEAAIEFVEFKFYNSKLLTDSVMYLALILRKDKPEPELVTLFEKKQLENLLVNRGKNSNALYSRDDGGEKANAAQKSIYQLIWQPVEKHLTEINKVYFASAGLLHRISFAALPVNSKEVLSDKYQLVQLNTTASVPDQSSYTITDSEKIALYGGISYNADSTALKNAVLQYAAFTDNDRSFPDDLTRGNIWQELKGTQVEIDGIKKDASTKYSVSVFSGINGTEESIKALNGKNSPIVLHIATHGFFFADPKEDKRDNFLKTFETSGRVFRQSYDPLFRSGLLFAGANNAWQGKSVRGIEDGILTAYEVSNMYLPNTKLVVLSACETALGDIHGSEGVYGLQRAFKMAGVHNLIMSLWKVPDAEAAEFMQLFYRYLFAKQTISNAFYNAQKMMKNKYRAEPYKWGAWVLVR